MQTISRKLTVSILGLGGAVAVVGSLVLLLWPNSGLLLQADKNIDADTINGRTIEYWLQQNEPIDAQTLDGHPGLFYLDAANLTGVISTNLFSAYDSLVDEGHIADESGIITSEMLNQALADFRNRSGQDEPVQIVTQSQLSSIKAGIGLAGGGNKGDVRLDVVAGEGIVVKNNALTAVIGNNVDLINEVVGVLSVANGGTGRASAPGEGKFVGEGGVESACCPIQARTLNHIACRQGSPIHQITIRINSSQNCQLRVSSRPGYTATA